MVGIGGLLACPHCGGTRFSRLSPPFSAASEARCAGCDAEATLAELVPALPPELTKRGDAERLSAP